MTILDEITGTRKRLLRTQEKLELLEMQACTPRASVISDMPKGGGNMCNPLEQYAIKSEKLHQKYNMLKRCLEKQWDTARRQMRKGNIDKQVQLMIYFRYCLGLKWNKCEEALSRRFPQSRWNINKVYWEHRKVVQYLERYGMENGC